MYKFTRLVKPVHAPEWAWTEYRPEHPDSRVRIYSVNEARLRRHLKDAKTTLSRTFAAEHFGKK